MKTTDQAILDMETKREPTKYDAVFEGTNTSYIEYKLFARRKKANMDYDSYITSMVKYAKTMGINFNQIRDQTVDIYFNNSAIV